jgi:hypothetical protein
MRIVIENGKNFTNKNYFMMLSELDHNHVDENAAKFLGIMKEELGITNAELEEYLRTMNFEQTQEPKVRRQSS